MTVSAPVDAFDWQCSFLSSPFFVSPLAITFSLSTRPLTQDNYEQITLLPALTASFLSFPSLSVSLFLCTSGNDEDGIVTISFVSFDQCILSLLFYLVCMPVVLACALVDPPDTACLVSHPVTLVTLITISWTATRLGMIDNSEV